MQSDLIEILEYKFAFSEPRGLVEYDLLTLSHDEKRDFKIESKYIEKRDAGYTLSAALALSEYLFKMRAFPACELDISSPVLNFELINKGVISFVKCEKCKYNFAKTRIEVFGAELFVKIDERLGVGLIECSNIRDFKDSVPREILLKDSNKLKALAAYGKTDGGYFIKAEGDFSLLGFALAVFSLLPQNEADTRFAFSRGSGGVIISRRGSFLYISKAPI